MLSSGSVEAVDHPLAQNVLCHPEPPKPPQVSLHWQPADIGGEGRSKDLKMRRSRLGVC
jgi:hypothetical protein